MIKRYTLLFSLLLLLAACSGKEEQATVDPTIIQQNKEAQLQMKTMQVTYDEGNDEFRHESFRSFNMEKNDAYIDTQLNGMEYYLRDGQAYFVGPDMTEEELQRETEFMALVLNEFQEIARNPLFTFERLTPNVEEVFSVEERDDTYVLTFAPTKAEFERVFHEFIGRSGIENVEEIDVTIPTYDEYFVEVVLDRETYLVQSTTHIEKYEYALNGQSFPQNRTTYTKDYRYDEPVNITVPEGALHVQ